MCGIAGEINYRRLCGEYPVEIYKKMQSELRRRGPDQSGMYLRGAAALIHARLCIIDIENGKQPMTFLSGDEEYTLVYNGELYNTKELKNELSALGHRFLGHSDTEVVLHAFVQWKENCVYKFNGIFAFAVWDKGRERLFAARDRMGVKPFFYHEEDGTFIFASEVKALLAHPLVPPRIDKNSVAEIILTGPGRTPGYGVFCGISELKPGEFAYFTKEDGFRRYSYFSLEDAENTDTFEETARKVRCLVVDSIERQLVSDVPVGTFLSGGLDSSIISAVSDRYFTERGQTLHTFSVEYEDNDKYFKSGKFQPSRDDSYIKIMNQALHAQHHTIILNNEELAQALYTAVEARDLPGMADVDSSLLLFCKRIKEFVTVALSGECADEIFGGYPWYRDPEIREKYGFPWAQSIDYRASFLKAEYRNQIDAHAYVNQRYAETLNQTSVLDSRNAEEKRMKEMVNLNFKWFMQTLLDRKDRMSMYSGLEVRVPFCDYRIAEYLYTVQWEYKDYNHFEKGLLRHAMRGILPDEVLWRKKSPYPKTHNPVYYQIVSGMLRDVLEDSSAPLLAFVDKNALKTLLNAEFQTPWYGQLMTAPQTIAYFLQVNYWLSKYKIEIL